jgi:hypothetical protein
MNGIDMKKTLALGGSLARAADPKHKKAMADLAVAGMVRAAGYKLEQHKADQAEIARLEEVMVQRNREFAVQLAALRHNCTVDALNSAIAHGSQKRAIAAANKRMNAEVDKLLRADKAKYKVEIAALAALKVNQ